MRVAVLQRPALDGEGGAGQGALGQERAQLGGRVKSRRPGGAHDVVDDAGVAGGEAVADIGHAAGRQAGPIGSKDL